MSRLHRHATAPEYVLEVASATDIGILLRATGKHIGDIDTKIETIASLLRCGCTPLPPEDEAALRSAWASCTPPPDPVPTDGEAATLEDAIPYAVAALARCIDCLAAHNRRMAGADPDAARAVLGIIADVLNNY